MNQISIFEKIHGIVTWFWRILTKFNPNYMSFHIVVVLGLGIDFFKAHFQHFYCSSSDTNKTNIQNSLVFPLQRDDGITMEGVPEGSDFLSSYIDLRDDLPRDKDINCIQVSKKEEKLSELVLIEISVRINLHLTYHD